MSPYGLLQEQLQKNDWKIFVCCIFCNLTKRVTAEPYFWKTLNKWSNPEKLANADYNEVYNLVKPLGLGTRRAKALINMSKDYLRLDWTDNPEKLSGIGKYGSDAFRLFCTENWRLVEPTDGALKNYKSWLLSK